MYVETECVTACWYNKTIESSLGLSSGCTAMKVSVRESLSKCLKVACNVGANVINFHSGVCELRKCKDGQDPDYTTEKGGWDVYMLGDNAALTKDEIHSTTPQYSTSPPDKDADGVQLQVIIPAVLVPVIMIIILIIVAVCLVMRRRIPYPTDSQPNEALNHDPQHVNPAYEPPMPDTDVYEVISNEEPYEQLQEGSREKHQDPYMKIE